ncbi:unnamed protein product [Caenorhabditis angaria]|uniref:VWFA domain-containing protein n=1 Tax=Caenorhabditis angaria TaxID=860376 RepID=A0A9P1I6Z7_9PELO|nr:unnamed protein product [Caenorhabditis angaria]
MICSYFLLILLLFDPTAGFETENRPESWSDGTEKPGNYPEDKPDRPPEENWTKEPEKPGNYPDNKTDVPDKPGEENWTEKPGNQSDEKPDGSEKPPEETWTKEPEKPGNYPDDKPQGTEKPERPPEENWTKNPDNYPDDTSNGSEKPGEESWTKQPDRPYPIPSPETENLEEDYETPCYPIDYPGRLIPRLVIFVIDRSQEELELRQPLRRIFDEMSCLLPNSTDLRTLFMDISSLNSTDEGFQFGRIEDSAEYFERFENQSELDFRTIEQRFEYAMEKLNESGIHQYFPIIKFIHLDIETYENEAEVAIVEKPRKKRISTTTFAQIISAYPEISKVATSSAIQLVRQFNNVQIAESSIGVKTQQKFEKVSSKAKDKIPEKLQTTLKDIAKEVVPELLAGNEGKAAENLVAYIIDKSKENAKENEAVKKTIEEIQKMIKPKDGQQSAIIDLNDATNIITSATSGNWLDLTKNVFKVGKKVAKHQGWDKKVKKGMDKLIKSKFPKLAKKIDCIVPQIGEKGKKIKEFYDDFVSKHPEVKDLISFNGVPLEQKLVDGGKMGVGMIIDGIFEEIDPDLTDVSDGVKNVMNSHMVEMEMAEVEIKTTETTIIKIPTENHNVHQQKVEQGLNVGKQLFGFVVDRGNDDDVNDAIFSTIEQATCLIKDSKDVKGTILDISDKTSSDSPISIDDIGKLGKELLKNYGKKTFSTDDIGTRFADTIKKLADGETPDVYDAINLFVPDFPNGGNGENLKKIFDMVMKGKSANLRDKIKFNNIPLKYGKLPSGKTSIGMPGLGDIGPILSNIPAPVIDVLANLLETAVPGITTILPIPIPNIPNILDLPNVPSFPNIPGLPNFPKIPDLLDIPDIPNWPNINLPDLPNPNSGGSKPDSNTNSKPKSKSTQKTKRPRSDSRQKSKNNRKKRCSNLKTALSIGKKLFAFVVDRGTDEEVTDGIFTTVQELICLIPSSNSTNSTNSTESTKGTILDTSDTQSINDLLSIDSIDKLPEKLAKISGKKAISQEGFGSRFGKVLKKLLQGNTPDLFDAIDIIAPELPNGVTESALKKVFNKVLDKYPTDIKKKVKLNSIPFEFGMDPDGTLTVGLPDVGKIDVDLPEITKKQKKKLYEIWKKIEPKITDPDDQSSNQNQQPEKEKKNKCKSRKTTPLLVGKTLFVMFVERNLGKEYVEPISLILKQIACQIPDASDTEGTIIDLTNQQTIDQPKTIDTIRKWGPKIEDLVRQTPKTSQNTNEIGKLFVDALEKFAKSQIPKEFDNIEVLTSNLPGADSDLWKKGFETVMKLLPDNVKEKYRLRNFPLDFKAKNVEIPEGVKIDTEEIFPDVTKKLFKEILNKLDPKITEQKSESEQKPKKRCKSKQTAAFNIGKKLFGLVVDRGNDKDFTLPLFDVMEEVSCLLPDAPDLKAMILDISNMNPTINVDTIGKLGETLRNSKNKKSISNKDIASRFFDTLQKIKDAGLFDDYDWIELLNPNFPNGGSGDNFKKVYEQFLKSNPNVEDKVRFNNIPLNFGVSASGIPTIGLPGVGDVDLNSPALPPYLKDKIKDALRKIDSKIVKKPKSTQPQDEKNRERSCKPKTTAALNIGKKLIGIILDQGFDEEITNPILTTMEQLVCKVPNAPEIKGQVVDISDMDTISLPSNIGTILELGPEILKRMGKRSNSPLDAPNRFFKALELLASSGILDGFDSVNLFVPTLPGFSGIGLGIPGIPVVLPVGLPIIPPIPGVPGLDGFIKALGMIFDVFPNLRPKITLNGVNFKFKLKIPPTGNGPNIEVDSPSSEDLDETLKKSDPKVEKNGESQEPDESEKCNKLTKVGVEAVKQLYIFITDQDSNNEIQEKVWELIEQAICSASKNDDGMVIDPINGASDIGSMEETEEKVKKNKEKSNRKKDSKCKRIQKVLGKLDGVIKNVTKLYKKIHIVVPMVNSTVLNDINMKINQSLTIASNMSNYAANTDFCNWKAMLMNWTKRLKDSGVKQRIEYIQIPLKVVQINETEASLVLEVENSTKTVEIRKLNMQEIEEEVVIYETNYTNSTNNVPPDFGGFWEGTYQNTYDPEKTNTKPVKELPREVRVEITHKVNESIIRSYYERTVYIESEQQIEEKVETSNWLLWLIIIIVILLLLIICCILICIYCCCCGPIAVMKEEEDEEEEEKEKEKEKEVVPTPIPKTTSNSMKEDIPPIPTTPPSPPPRPRPRPKKKKQAKLAPFFDAKYYRVSRNPSVPPTPPPAKDVFSAENEKKEIPKNATRSQRLYKS